MTAVYAHRLGRDAGPDSSRTALRRSLNAGVAGLETDVCLTADGRLACLHDPWVASCTTATGWAIERTWEELAGARILRRDGTPSRDTPLAVEDLFALVGDEPVLQLEVKAHGDPELAERTAAAVCAAAAAAGRDPGRTEILSFHAAACAEAARRGWYARLVTWADFDPAGLAAWAARHGVRGVCVEHFLLHAELVDALRDGGLSVTTGTVDALELARRAAALGVDAITSDRPWALREPLSAGLSAAGAGSR